MLVNLIIDGGPHVVSPHLLVQVVHEDPHHDAGAGGDLHAGLVLVAGQPARHLHQAVVCVRIEYLLRLAAAVPGAVCHHKVDDGVPGLARDGAAHHAVAHVGQQQHI